jgi:hypothetical protein
MISIATLDKLIKQIGHINMMEHYLFKMQEELKNMRQEHEQLLTDLVKENRE